ncbi:CooT family nickel-binding protein [Thermococcus sp. LS1]|uniref:CooT family nickel-binding protein n=2 Tax=unclassified Thermococcus TaxID=2627626 RepID=UPI001439D3C8|nr:CooT family nickel-binding protein [Thermococcus sp. LS1]NJD99831.1 CooT family nickel-binding protein [Thermococcus sp. LS1]
MCESKAVVVENGKEEIIMEDVAFLYFKEGKPVIRDILGREMLLEDYELDSIDFLRHIMRFKLRG